MTMNYILLIPIIGMAASLWAFFRNNSVYKFRRTVIDALFKSKHWEELSEEFDYISYDKMLLSFKPLRIERWYSEEFCREIEEIQKKREE